MSQAFCKPHSLPVCRTCYCVRCARWAECNQGRCEGGQVNECLSIVPLAPVDDGDWEEDLLP